MAIAPGFVYFEPSGDGKKGLNCSNVTTNKRKTFLNDEGGKIESYLLNKAVEKKVIDRNAIRKKKGGKGA